MAEAEYVVRIPEDLNKDMQHYCKLLGLKPEELIRHAVDRFYGGEPFDKEVFGKTRKWFVPRSCFIVFALPYEEHKKLRTWIRKKHRIHILPTANREVIILNETKLNKWEERKYSKA